MESGGYKDEVIWGLGEEPGVMGMAGAASCHRAKERFADGSDPTTALSPCHSRNRGSFSLAAAGMAASIHTRRKANPVSGMGADMARLII